MPEVKTIRDTPDGLGLKMVKEQFLSFDRFHINDNGNLYDFHRFGLDYLKMGNRPFLLDHKLMVLEIAREFLERLEDPALSREDFSRTIRSDYPGGDAPARHPLHSENVHMVFETAKCLIPPALASFSKDANRYGRMYLGSETCEWLLPNLQEVEQALQIGNRVSLLTPPVTSLGLNKIRRILEHLRDDQPTLEIVANDFGVLEILKNFDTFTPVLGRILTKNFIEIIDGNTLGVTTSKALDFLHRDYRVSRLELTSYPKKLAFPPPDSLKKFSLSMVYPLQNLTTSRQCVFRFHNVSPLKRVDQVGCSRRCLGRAFRIRFPNMVKEDLFLKGNTLYSETGKMPYSAAELKRLGVDRLVGDVSQRWNGDFVNNRSMTKEKSRLKFRDGFVV